MSKIYNLSHKLNEIENGVADKVILKKTQTTLLDFPLEYTKPVNLIVQAFIDCLRAEQRYEKNKEVV